MEGKGSCDMIFPKVEPQKIYAKIEEYIVDGKFTFDVNELPLLEEFEEIIGEKTVKVASAHFNTRENHPLFSRRPAQAGKNFMGESEDYDNKLIDYSQEHPTWKDDSVEWLYLIVFNGRIVKAGMTITDLKSRYGSYSCGTRKAMSKGSCSTTNYIITECNYAALRQGMSVEIYGLPVPKRKVEVNRFGVTSTVNQSQVRDMEEMLTQVYVDNYGTLPILCVQQGKSL